jgi:putative nucleotidyltransferase with HDIG domain
MKFSTKKPLNILFGLSLIVVVSLTCSFLLWYQRILPPKFYLGMRSPVKLVTHEERTILDIEATENEKFKAKRKAISQFLEKPQLERNDSLQEQSLAKLDKLSQEIDNYFLFKTTNLKANFISLEAQLKLIAASDQEIKDFWIDDNVVSLTTDKQLESVLQELQTKHSSPNKIKSEVEALRNNFANSPLLSNKVKDLILKTSLTQLSLSDWKEIKVILQPASIELLDNGYLGVLPESSLRHLISKLKKFKEIPGSTDLNNGQIQFLQTLLENELKANLKIHFNDFNQIEEKAISGVEPIWKNLPAQTTILSPGELITKEKFSIVEQLNLNRRDPNFSIFKEAFWTTLLVILSFWLYVRLEKFQLSFRQMLLLSALVIGASAFVGLVSYEMPAALPLAAVAMITGLFFKPTVGFSAGTLFGVLCMQAIGINVTALLPSFVGVIVGTILSQKAKNRADLAQAGVWLGISQVLAFILVAGMSKNVPISLTEIAIQGTSGLITALIVSSVMPYLESLFSVTTRFRLLELSDPNQPLLQKLHDEAPGTYEHTLVVAGLAQDAAKKIEADYELVRVGILYHDIGKLYNPQVFIENQFGGENPHNTMSPTESAQAIIAHVSEGITLAKKYRLPEPICSFIPAHQGTSRAGHFFLKACQQDPTIKDDTAFRYPGPKPNSKETGIAMLADTVEATIRSLKTDNKDLVKETITNLVESRVQDKQLSDSSLTKAELAKIAESFYESWKNKNHERLRYISDLKK